MKRSTAWIITIAFLAVCGQTAAQSTANASVVDIWTAVAEGNIQAIRQHLEVGTDLNAKEPTGGGTPLITAAAYGQSEAAKLLIENGANVNGVNYEGSTALHTAAFFCHSETVKLLLDKGAEVNAQNDRGDTALDTVAAQWGEELEGVYRYFAGLLQVELDIERVKATRPTVAATLRRHGGKTGSELE
jgi:ankyrin repeat protein